jgi:hypothetical protein
MYAGHWTSTMALTKPQVAGRVPMGLGRRTAATPACAAARSPTVGRRTDTASSATGPTCGGPPEPQTIMFSSTV